MRDNYVPTCLRIVSHYIHLLTYLHYLLMPDCVPLVNVTRRRHHVDLLAGFFMKYGWLAQKYFNSA